MRKSSTHLVNSFNFSNKSATEIPNFNGEGLNNNTIENSLNKNNCRIDTDTVLTAEMRIFI